MSRLDNDFKPTDIGFFHLRPESTKQPTTDNCAIDNVRYQLIDVCGSRCERYITSGLFGIHCVIFAVALSGYCRRLLSSNGVVSKVHPLEDESNIDRYQNQMKDAMRAFSEINALVSVPIVLLFTKFDVLEKNLGIHPFQDYFPDYTGSQNAFDICAYFAFEFGRLDLRPNGILHIRVVNATDPHDFQHVSKASGIFTVPPEGYPMHWQAGRKSLGGKY